MNKLTMRNEFHGTAATIIPRADGTISAATYRRAGRQLCPVTGCRCGSSSASGPDMLLLGHAEPVWQGAAIVAYRLYDR